MLATALAAFAATALAQAPSAQSPAPAAPPRFAHGLPRDPSFFPIGVWLQAPANAARYRELGIDLYVGLWEGPTEAQLAELDRAGMKVICPQNPVGLAHRGDTIVGWMHGDEPDNAQAAAVGYGPPIPPATLVEAYEKLHRADPTRPVLLNLGQGAAWDGWHGRGARTNHPEDYPEYCKGCDLVSFDIYPVTHQKPAVTGKLEFVGQGVRRLRDATGGHKPVWACLETTHVDNASARPTPQQVRDEAWIAIACGASGLVYFAHEFQPKFVEAGLLAYPEIADAVKAVNAEVHALAPVLNSPPATRWGRVDVSIQGDPGDEATALRTPDSQLAVRAHRDGKDLVLIAASLSGKRLAATFTLAGNAAPKVVSLPEQTPWKVAGSRFLAEFAPYECRRFRVTP